MSQILPFVRMRDGLINLLTGRGTSVDRGANSFWHFVKKDHNQIVAAYRSNWLTAKIVDLPVRDMTREWRDWQADKGDIEKIEAVEAQLQLRDKLRTALTYGRLGGGALILGFGDANPMAPAPENAPLTFVHVLSRYQISLSDQVYDPADPLYMQPRWFMLNTNGGQFPLHPSRVIPFKGEMVPNMGNVSWDDAFWGDSIIDRVDKAVQNAITASDGFASLIDEAKIDIFRFNGLADTLMQPDGEDKMMARVKATTVGKSTHRATILDALDIWEQRQISWAGMPEMIRTYYSIVAGAADIPATKLFGKAPDGMNATGEGDERNYLATIKAMQEERLRPAILRLDPHIKAMAKVTAPDAWWQFAPLSTLTETEAADIAKKKAETAQIYANSGLVSQDALAEGVQNMLIEDGTYPGLQEAIEDVENDPEDDDGNPSELVATNGREAISQSPTARASSGSRAPARAANDKATTKEGE